MESYGIIQNSDARFARIVFTIKNLCYFDILTYTNLTRKCRGAWVEKNRVTLLKLSASSITYFLTLLAILPIFRIAAAGISLRFSVTASKLEVISQ